MRTLANIFGITAVALAGSAAHGSDFTPLMDVVKSTWPERTSIGVIADYGRSRNEIVALAKAMGDGGTIYVLDVRNRGHVASAANQLHLRAKPDVLVLLPNDPMLREGSPEATRAVRQIANLGVPTVGTTPKAIAQGAVFAMGDGTQLDLLVTEKLVGTVEVILPQRGRFLNQVARADRGRATITMVAAF